MIYIIAGNLQQAVNCATKYKLHEDLWMFVNFSSDLDNMLEGDSLWLTGSYMFRSDTPRLRAKIKDGNLTFLEKP